MEKSYAFIFKKLCACEWNMESLEEKLAEVSRSAGIGYVMNTLMADEGQTTLLNGLDSQTEGIISGAIATQLRSNGNQCSQLLQSSRR